MSLSDSVLLDADTGVLRQIAGDRSECVVEPVGQSANLFGRVLGNPKNSNAGRNLTALQDAAREKGVQLHIVEASAEADFEKAFASLASLQAGALVVGADPFFNARRSQIVALAAQIPCRRSTSGASSLMQAG